MRGRGDDLNLEPHDQQRVDREQHSVERWRQVEILHEVQWQRGLMLKEHDADQDYTTQENQKTPVV